MITGDADDARVRLLAASPTHRRRLVGDSHAQQWQGAVFAIARDVETTLSYLGGCPPADVTNGCPGAGGPR